jgi:hypothetical protein
MKIGQLINGADRSEERKDEENQDKIPYERQGNFLETVFPTVKLLIYLASIILESLYFPTFS